MKEAYFTNTPLYGDLFLEEVLFPYDNIPIIFTCKTKDNIRCICVCDDIIENQSWIITRISSEVLLAVLYDKISICKAFEISDDNTIIAELVDGEIKYLTKPYKKIDPMELPDPDEKLDMQDELYSFIKLIEFENLHLKLDLIIDSKEECNYSYSFNFKSDSNSLDTSNILDTLSCYETISNFCKVSIDYIPTELDDFVTTAAKKNEIGSDINLLNAA